MIIDRSIIERFHSSNFHRLDASVFEWRVFPDQVIGEADLRDLGVDGCSLPSKIRLIGLTQEIDFLWSHGSEDENHGKYTAPLRDGRAAVIVLHNYRNGLR